MSTFIIESIEAVVARTYEEGPAAVTAALLAREDTVADALRLLATNFGLYPEVVAEVLTNAVRLGTPVPEDTHALIRQQYEELVARIQRGEQP